MLQNITGHEGSHWSGWGKRFQRREGWSSQHRRDWWSQEADSKFLIFHRLFPFLQVFFASGARSYRYRSSYRMVLCSVRSQHVRVYSWCISNMNYCSHAWKKSGAIIRGSFSRWLATGSCWDWSLKEQLEWMKSKRTRKQDILAKIWWSVFVSINDVNVCAPVLLHPTRQVLA